VRRIQSSLRTDPPLPPHLSGVHSSSPPATARLSSLQQSMSDGHVHCSPFRRLALQCSLFAVAIPMGIHGDVHPHPQPLDPQLSTPKIPKMGTKKLSPHSRCRRHFTSMLSVRCSGFNVRRSPWGWMGIYIPMRNSLILSWLGPKSPQMGMKNKRIPIPHGRPPLRFQLFDVRQHLPHGDRWGFKSPCAIL
jgi:hypothetical protein